MNRHQLKARILSSEPVKILNGTHAGEYAYVTNCDDTYVRVTPLHGDPLVSISLKHSDIDVTRIKRGR